MDEWMPERTGRYRPTVPKRIPRAIPDEWFDKLFASLGSDRDRALVALWISTGARASELLGMRQCGFKPGEQLISVSARTAAFSLFSLFMTVLPPKNRVYPPVT
jgi:site-specific recombinase XerC